MIDKSYSDFGHYIIYSVPVTVPVPLKTTCLFTRKCFDLCINTSKIDIDEAVEIILATVKKHYDK